MELIDVAGLFGVSDILNIHEINGGHINMTFMAECSGGDKYIIQSVNRNVFTDPIAVMRNISIIEKIFDDEPDERVDVPHFLCVDSGENYAETENGFYRMYRFSEQDCHEESRFYMTGYSFGTFMRRLSRKNVRLKAAIENFHSFESYFSVLMYAGKLSRLKKIDNTIIRRLSSLSETLAQVFTVDFPKRNVHSDAKISNIIFGRRCTVIDLDTAMNGYAAIDYGDMIRSVCTSEKLDFDIIRDVTRGFSDGLCGILSDDEIYSLYYGVLYVTGELAVRYLIDYLSDDKYFKGKTSSECLNRANELLRQLNLFIVSGDDITAIIYEFFKKK